MTNIQSDNKKIKDIIEKTSSLIKAEGGFISEQLKFVCSDGQLQCTSSLATHSNDPLIFLPKQCMPSLLDFNINMNNGLMSAIPLSPETPELETSLVNLMLEMFNETGKIAEFKQQCPWIIFAKDTELIQSLAHSRLMDLDAMKHRMERDLDQYCCEEFLTSRRMNYNTADGTHRKDVVMPLIDFVNHHSTGPSLQSPDSTGNKSLGDGLTLINTKPNENSDECYYQYNFYDALNSYLSYRYVDQSAVVLRSVPIELNVKGVGKIIVKTNTRSAPSLQLPPALNGLGLFFPEIATPAPGVFELSDITVPNKSAPRALRRVLEVIIRNTLGRNIDNGALSQLVATAENNILKENDAFYQKLEQLADQCSLAKTDSAITMLKAMISHQQMILQNYRMFTQHMPYVFLPG